MPGAGVMSAAAGNALVGIVIALAGLLFARMGWVGLRGPAASHAPAAAAPARKLLSIAVFLFGLFALACGLLLILSIFLPE